MLIVIHLIKYLLQETEDEIRFENKKVCEQFKHVKQCKRFEPIIIEPTLEANQFLENENELYISLFGFEDDIIPMIESIFSKQTKIASIDEQIILQTLNLMFSILSSIDSQQQDKKLYSSRIDCCAKEIIYLISCKNCEIIVNRIVQELKL